jgi:hypothetical protein
MTRWRTLDCESQRPLVGADGKIRQRNPVERVGEKERSCLFSGPAVDIVIVLARAVLGHGRHGFRRDVISIKGSFHEHPMSRSDSLFENHLLRRGNRKAQTPGLAGQQRESIYLFFAQPEKRLQTRIAQHSRKLDQYFAARQQNVAFLKQAE